jgi:hypothetical protein
MNDFLSALRRLMAAARESFREVLDDQFWGPTPSG